MSKAQILHVAWMGPTEPSCYATPPVADEWFAFLQRNGIVAEPPAETIGLSGLPFQHLTREVVIENISDAELKKLIDEFQRSEEFLRLCVE